MNVPLVSVIIPTVDRPAYLERAVTSAFLAAPGGNVEVIIIPNGPADTWRDLASKLHDDVRVRWHSIATRGVSAARNQGMAVAAGKYLRFLDDDDYLLPAASAQLVMMERTGADVCSGLLSNVDEDDIDSGVNSAPVGEDFVCGVVGLSGFRLPHGNLWRRSAVQSCLWDVSIREGEDYAWMLDLAAAKERHWIKIDEPVGVWFQHRGPRGSNIHRPTDRKEGVVSHLFGLQRRLAATGRLTTDRCSAIANALWQYIHTGFPSHPVYWSQVARQALAIDPASRPSDRFYTTGPFRKIDPLLCEWALLPVRILTRRARDMPFLWRNRDYRRKL